MEFYFKKNLLLGNPISTTAYSKVYKAIDINSQRTFCVKEIDLSIAPDRRVKAELLSIIEQELEALAISGDAIANVPCLFDSYHDQKGDKFYIIMQWVDGAPLSQKMNCPTVEFLNYMIKLAKILIELHKLHIYHKDIKPDNIMIKGNDVYLIDFNISLALPNLYQGTRGYAAPEMTMRSGEVSREYCDIFSLGVIMYKYFTGVMPTNGIHYCADFTNPKNKEWASFKTAKEIAKENGTFLRDDINNIITTCLKKNPTSRYGDLRLFLSELQKIKRSYNAK